MGQKSKRHSTQKKQKSISKQRQEIDLKQNNQQIRKIKDEQKKVKITKSYKKSQSKSQTKGNKKGKRNEVAPVKKKIIKGKKQQNKKQSLKKEIIKTKVERKQPKEQQNLQLKKNNKEIPINKRKKTIQKQKVNQKKQIKKKIEKKVKKSKSQEKKVVSVNKSQGKKKEKSYFDILYDFISTHDKGLETEPAPVYSEKHPYQLIEDIKIIYAVAQDDKHEGLGPVFWNELANKKIMQRPVESMRDRYKRYIRFLDKNDFDKIISYLRDQGTDGYMIFSKGEDGNKKLLNIQLQDPSLKIDQQQQLTEGIQKPKDHKSLEIFSKIMSKKQEIKAKKQFSGKDEEKFFPIISDQMSSNFKKIAIQAAKPIIKSNSTMLSSTLLEEFPMMKSVQNQAAKSLECIIQTSYTVHTDFQGHRFSTQQKITDIKDLNSVVNMLHFQFNKSRSEIIEDLQDVNGNIQSLIQIYQQPVDNAHLRWTPEDDNILQKCKSKDDISLKLLVRYKGEDSVRNRIKFKKFVLPFTY